MRRRVSSQLVVLALGIAGVAGCGGDEDGYANDPRPPSPVAVTAAITDRGVTVSPERLGAGPVNLTVANLTDQAHELTLETDEIGGTGGGIRQTTGPINPGDTAQLRADLASGSYEVSIAGERPASLRVGARRPSAQDQLLQP
jgi:hypothetical protein